MRAYLAALADAAHILRVRAHEAPAETQSRALSLRTAKWLSALADELLEVRARGYAPAAQREFFDTLRIVGDDPKSE